MEGNHKTKRKPMWKNMQNSAQAVTQAQDQIRAFTSWGGNDGVIYSSNLALTTLLDQMKSHLQAIEPLIPSDHLTCWKHTNGVCNPV